MFITLVILAFGLELRLAQIQDGSKAYHRFDIGPTSAVPRST